MLFDRRGLDKPTYEAARAAGIQGRLLGWGRGPEAVATVWPEVFAVRREGGGWELTRWERIDVGLWDGSGALQWSLDDGSRHTLGLSEPRDLPPVFRRQVDASFVVRRHIDVPGSKLGATVVARRSPASSRPADVTWRCIPAAGTKLDSAEARAAVAAEIERAAAQFAGA